nr:2-oxoglutarate-Fe(II) type oxidoreductase isoform X2 [Quercus suber]
MTEALKLPIIDLISPDRISTANSIRQACIDYGFFYLVNHGMEEELLGKVFEESKKFFLLPLEEKMKMPRKEHRGYTPLYAENLDPTSSSKGDPKESFYIGPLEDITTPVNLNQWPSEEEDFFEKVGALDEPNAFLRLLHYPGELGSSDDEIYGSSAHSDYGMVTLLATDGVQGLQVCREKFKQPRVWEDVLHVDGALIVNIGDIMERWTNCLFRSTLHRVMLSGKERYSAAFFLDPNPDCMVECLESCCSESSPPRFPPIRGGDYLQERLRLTYAS